jgi:diacylglycerol kinase family enzyme
VSPAARPRLCLIVNPVASGVTPRSIADAVHALQVYCDVEERRTERRGHATELAHEAIEEGFDALVILAGDGTANEVLNGVGPDVPVGVLPAGGTSVLPRALGLPRSVAACARLIGDAARTRTTRPLTLGTINGRRFAFAAGIGFDADAVRRVDEAGRDKGRRPGDAYFALQVARVFGSGRYAHPVLTVEAGGTTFRGTTVLVANCHPWSYLGPFPLRLAPFARFDGGLDAVVPQDMRLRYLMRYARYLLLTGGHAAGHDPVLRYLHDLDELVVRCDRPLPVQADGDDLGDYSEIRLGVVRNAARLLV